MKTLAKVAIGVAVAKGARAMLRKGGSGSSGAGGLGGLLGGLTGSDIRPQDRTPANCTPASGKSSRSGGIEDMLGSLLGGGAGAGGGLGGLLSSLGGRNAPAGTNDLLASTDENRRYAPRKDSNSFGAVLNSQFDTNPVPEIEPTKEDEATAALLLSAMIQAAKSDGIFDEDEREKLLAHVGDVTAQEAEFIKARLKEPVDVDRLVRQTPDGMGPQVYAMSLLGIDLDTRPEAEYLHKLAQGLGMTPTEVNGIHAEMGVPSLYT